MVSNLHFLGQIQYELAVLIAKTKIQELCAERFLSVVSQQTLVEVFLQTVVYF